MNYAWQQIGDVLDANRLIRRLHLADRGLRPLVSTSTSRRWPRRNPERAFALTAPVAARVLASPNTIAYLQAQSLVPPVLTSTAHAPRARARAARLMRSLPFDATVTPHNLLARVNAGEVSAAPPKVVPPGVPTVDQAAGAAAPRACPPGSWRCSSAYRWIPEALLALAILIVLALLLTLPLRARTGRSPPDSAAAVALRLPSARALAGGRTDRARRSAKAARRPTAVDRLPNSPDFVLETTRLELPSRAPATATARPQRASRPRCATRSRCSRRARLRRRRSPRDRSTCRA